MKYKSLGDFSFLMDENHFIYDYVEDESTLLIYVKSKPHGSCCPECGSESRQIHATYERILQDTPIHCKQTFIHANVYKYECLNPSCTRSVFMENLPFAKPPQVRTDPLNALILGVSMFLSNEGASKVLGLLGIKISNDAIQRLYDNIEFEDDPDVEGIGVDDVAIRKGQKYATAIYDLKDHHLIALLEGRDGQSLREWLKQHKKVKVVARDRASAYASAISEIIPECIQVADRFHLLQNLLDRMKDIFKEDMPPEIFIHNSKVLNKAPEKVLKEKMPDERLIGLLHYDNSVPQTSDGTEIKFDNKKHDPNSRQYREQAERRKEKQQLIYKIQKYWNNIENKKIKQVAEEFQISPLTARNYINMTEEEIRLLDKPLDYRKRTTVMDEYINIIFKMQHDGISDDLIYFYILKHGYGENPKTLWNYIYCIEKNNFPYRTPMNPKYLLEWSYPDDVTVIKRNNLLKYLLTKSPKTKKDETIGKYIDEIKANYPAVEIVEEMFDTFHSIIMGSDPSRIDNFIEKYRDSKIASFCNGIERDIAPVKNAISLEVSSGFVEGNNNKFKLIKRIVYGRSGLVNLAKKCTLAFLSKRSSFNLTDLI